MAEFTDSETCLWFKTRSSQLSEIDNSQPILEEQHSLSLSPERQPQATVSSAKEKRESESGLCSSSEPEVVVIKENQGTEEGELGFANGVVMNMKCDEEDGSQFVSEKEKDSKKFDAGFSGNRESGENHIGAEDWKEFLGTSCVTFDGTESEKNQESITYALTHVSDFIDLKSKREIMDDNIKIEEGFDSSSCVVDGYLGNVEIPSAGGKGNTYEEMHKMEGSNGETRKCALKIEVIDETAVIDTTCGSKCGNGIVKGKGVVGCEHSEGNVDKNVMKHETDGKREKRSRRKAKGAKKLLGRNGKENILTHMSEVQNGCQKRGYGAKRAYSRLEMEDLRFVNLDAQRKKWIEVYCGLGPTVAREYDGLIDSNNQKNIHIDFDPRNQFGKKEKKTQIGILGEDSLQTMDDKIKNMNPLDPAFGIRASGEDGDTGVKGECSEDDDSNDDYSSIQRPAFVVTGEPDFDSGPPQDGLEYLRRVRWEAAQVPKVKVAKLQRTKLSKEQTAYMPIIPDIEKCPEHLLPLKQWQDAFLADFSELRMALSCLDGSSADIFTTPQVSSTIHKKEALNQLPDSIISKNLDNLTTDGVESYEALNNSIMDETTNPKPFAGGSSSDSPRLSAVLGMDSVARLSMLRKRISFLEKTSSLLRNDCAWLFALCAAIDTPLDADTCAALRCLLRKCSTLRVGKSELDDEVVMLNILATITGKYFGQSEF